MAEAEPQTQPADLASRPAEVPSESVYVSLHELLVRRGWTQGRCTKGRLTLDAAVDELLGTRPGDPATGAALARAARVTSHLRTLSGGPSLAFWNDAAERRVQDVHELLVLAGRAYPDD
jgi:hypothetical protein